MIDNFMFWIHGFVIAYHSFRGSGLSVRNSFWMGVKVTWTRPPFEKTISEFQENMWNAMKDMARKDINNEYTSRANFRHK